MIAIATLILIALAAYFNSLMDREAEEGKITTWMDKWAMSTGGVILPNTKRLWYYFWLYKPRFKEAFPYSSTILVWLTDPWHFYQMLFHTCWQVAIAINIPGTYLQKLVYFCILKIEFSLLFQFFYKK